jgi:D-alanyl-lipoteichoic acid acyltransferase DltB (MBOAT superfamily)
MSWNWRFIPLLAGLTAVDYVAAIWIETTEGRGRTVALLISLAANLGLLGFFKYYNFAANTIAALLGVHQDAWRLAIVLPLGISFHTFQSISYVVDVYRRQQKPVRRFFDYALFISFFPQLVAGPIVRAKQFFRDQYNWQPPSDVEIKRAVLAIAMGLVKKSVLADNLAPVADAYFGNPGHGQVAPWTGVLAFGLQIFFDFSGYTDIAIGCALLLGYRFPKNFDRPYLAASVTEFWRRWHMTLSSWLRDYVYIPLGGNRRGRVRTYANLLLTMLVGGLWHGANWTFVAWGGYHGVLLAAERATGMNAWPLRGVRIVPTFLLVCIGWVFFRSDSFRQATAVLNDLGRHPLGLGGVDPVIGFFITISLTIAIAEERTGWLSRLPEASALVVGFAVAVLLFIAELCAAQGERPFVYFQF